MLNVFRIVFTWLPFFIFGEDASLPFPEPAAGSDIETSHFFYEFMKMFFILGAMVAVLLGISWYMKKLTNKRFDQVNDDSYIKVIERRSLSPRSMIYLLDIEGKSFIIGETPHGLVRLGEYVEEKSPS